ncbi:MAG: glycosyltransferase family 4 protein [Nitrosomonadales bacterium]|nr:glycosyltransferase family 4 protein [Nitrosomonadales bacterium]
MTYFAPICSALVTVLLLAFILSSKFGYKIQDIPNERSLHSRPVPRMGGVGLMAGVLAGWLLMADAMVWWLLLPMAILFTVSLLDDMRGMPVRVRLSAQLLAAAILVGGSGFFAQQGIVVALLLLLLTVWMTNLYNFMDGSNGLAGGMALFGFAAYGIAALVAQNDTLAMLNFTIGAAALGFLFFNFHPARVFMGDAGSIPLGFLAAAMGLWGWQQSCWAAWFPLLVFSPFIVDASVTLLKRSLRGAKVTEAHREHYYQRAIQMGWSHRSVALVEYGLMLASAAVALPALGEAFPVLTFMVCGGVYAGLMLSLDATWKKFVRGQHA